MNSVIFALSLIAYAIAALWQCWALAKRKEGACHIGFFALSVVAIAAHGYLLFQWIDIGGQQNLTVLNLLSMVVWVVCLLLLATNLRRAVASLSVFVYPLAVISVLLAGIFPSDNLLSMRHHQAELIHILLSIVTFSVVCLAGVQALYVGVSNYLLKSKQTQGVLQALPPLESLERLLFQTLTLAFILLTADIGLSFYVFHRATTMVYWDKALLSIGAWCVFASLLVGRKWFGLRGSIAIRWTFIGVFLVLLCSLYIAIR